MTPAGVAGAVAIIQIVGDVPHACAAMNIKEPHVGAVTLCSPMAIDQALVARPSESCLQLMPHGGTAVVREILRALSSRGLPEATAASPRDEFPEARDQIEARMLRALSAASSPLAVDLLHDQPRRWREAGNGPEVGAAHSIMLRRLLSPPLVVMVGPANVGKSSLLNRLAGRSVAIVADVPGTTRDHVGVLLDFGGVVVRFVDTPGLRTDPDPIESQALASAKRLVERADLVVSVADVQSPFVEWSRAAPLGKSTLRIGLRCDLGPTPGAQCSVSSRTGSGLEQLSALIREALVSSEALADPRPWRFWAD